MEEHKKRLNADPSSFVELSEYPVKPDADESEKMVQFLCTVGKLKSIERTGWILDHRRTISKPETVAGKILNVFNNVCKQSLFYQKGHMYRMGIMGMLFDDDDDVKPTENGQLKKAKTEKLDISKMVQMSLVHDMAECITGDITPYDNINETEKHRRESEAMKNLGMFYFMSRTSRFLKYVICKILKLFYLLSLVAMLPSSVARKFTKLYEEYEARETAESKVVKEFGKKKLMNVHLRSYFAPC